MQKESCSRLCSKSQHKLFWRVLSSCMSNTNIAGIKKKSYDQMWRYFGNNGHCVSKVWCKCSKERSMFLAYFNKIMTKKKQKKSFKNIWTQKVLNQTWVSIYKKIVFCHIKSHLNLKSSLLMLDFSVWLSVQYTHLVPYKKTQKYAQKTYWSILY